jgi:hypothetical protein
VKDIVELLMVRVEYLPWCSQVAVNLSGLYSSAKMQLPGPMYHQAEHIPSTGQHIQSNSIISIRVRMQ